MIDLSWFETTISVTSLAMAGWSLWRSARSEKSALQARERAEALHTMSLRWSEQARQQKWASEACDALARGAHLIRGETKAYVGQRFLEHRAEICSDLSSLIDRGRWYLPNNLGGGHGAHKEVAYRGLRRPALDHLVGAYDALWGVSPEATSAELASAELDLQRARRHFVSEMAQLLAVRDRADTLEALSDDTDKPEGAASSVRAA